jgi:hypothetical protein
MIQRRARRDQLAHDAGVAQVRRRDQGCAVVSAGGEPGARAFGQKGPQRLAVVGDGGDGHRVVTVVLERAQVGTGAGQRPDRGGVAGESRHVQGRAAVAVATIQLDPGGDQFRKGRQVAAMRGGVQSGIARHLVGPRAGLCLRQGAGQSTDRQGGAGSQYEQCEAGDGPRVGKAFHSTLRQDGAISVRA